MNRLQLTRKTADDPSQNSIYDHWTGPATGLYHASVVPDPLVLHTVHCIILLLHFVYLRIVTSFFQIFFPPTLLTSALPLSIKELSVYDFFVFSDSFKICCCCGPMKPIETRVWYSVQREKWHKEAGSERSEASFLMELDKSLFSGESLVLQ